MPPKRLPQEYTTEERAELEAFREAVADEIYKNFTKFAKRSSPGPGGSRTEHWEPMGDSEWGMITARQMARLATGDLPNVVRQTLPTARLSGLKKDYGGCRILGIGGAIRRMVFKQAATILKPEIQEYVGPLQFGMQKDGCGRLFRLVQATMAINPNMILVTSDQTTAYNRIEKEAIMEGAEEVGTVYACLCFNAIVEDTHHVIQGGTCFDTVKQVVGADQGCPASTAMWCSTMKRPHAKANQKLKTSHPQASAPALCDDTYFIGPPQIAFETHKEFHAEMKEMGCKEQTNKRVVLLGRDVTPDMVPEEFRPYIKETCMLVGNVNGYARNDRPENNTGESFAFNFAGANPPGPGSPGSGIASLPEPNPL